MNIELFELCGALNGLAKPSLPSGDFLLVRPAGCEPYSLLYSKFQNIFRIIGLQYLRFHSLLEFSILIMLFLTLLFPNI